MKKGYWLSGHSCSHRFLCKDRRKFSGFFSPGKQLV